MAARVQCLAQGGINQWSRPAHFLVGGAHPPTPHLLPPNDIAPDRASRAQPSHWKMGDGEGAGKGSPRDQRPSSQAVSADGGSWRCLCRVVSPQVGAAEGSEWLPGWQLPEKHENPKVCTPPAPTPEPWGSVGGSTKRELRVEGTAHIRSAYGQQGLAPLVKPTGLG